MREGFWPGGGAARELVAYRLDRGFAGVPKTAYPNPKPTPTPTPTPTPNPYPYSYPYPYPCPRAGAQDGGG